MVRVDPDKKVSADIALAETIQPPTPEGSGERKSSIREEKLFSSLAETTRKKSFGVQPGFRSAILYLL